MPVRRHVSAALDRPHGHPDVVNPSKPELSTRGPVGELPACLSDQLDHAKTDAASASPRIPGDQALKPTGTPPRSPAPNRPDAYPETARCRRRTVKPSVVNHHQPLSDSPPVLQAHLHIAQSDHQASPGQLDCP